MSLGRYLREAFLGPAYFWHRRLIRASKTWSPERIAAYQAQKTAPLLSRYGDVVRDKAHYREQLARYTRLGLPGLTSTIRTGGTTGSPFAFAMDTFARRQKERAYIFDIWAEVGYRPFDTRVVYRGNIGDALISYNRLENAWSINPARLTAATRDSVIAFLRGLGPFFLHVYPSSLFSFIDTLGAEVFRALPVRGVMAGSEAFPAGQMAAFEREYGIGVAHWYGHSEYACLARYCRLCQGFHFYPTYGAVEFVPQVEAEAGLCHIVATSFNAVGTQFVRYDTGDLARVSATACSAPFVRVDAIEGRVQEYFIDRGGQLRAFGPYLFGIHNRFWDILSAIQFVQSEPGRLSVRVALKDAGEQAWLEAFLRDRFAVVELDMVYVDAIKRTAAGKHRYYINQLQAGAAPART